MGQTVCKQTLWGRPESPRNKNRLTYAKRLFPVQSFFFGFFSLI